MGCKYNIEEIMVCIKNPFSVLANVSVLVSELIQHAL